MGNQVVGYNTIVSTSEEWRIEVKRGNEPSTHTHVHQWSRSFNSQFKIAA